MLEYWLSRLCFWTAQNMSYSIMCVAETVNGGEHWLSFPYKSQGVALAGSIFKAK